jgi:hypothetical protein
MMLREGEMQMGSFPKKMLGNGGENCVTWRPLFRIRDRNFNRSNYDKKVVIIQFRLTNLS